MILECKNPSFLNVENALAMVQEKDEPCLICNQSRSAEHVLESEHQVQQNVWKISHFQRTCLMGARISIHC